MSFKKKFKDRFLNVIKKKSKYKKYPIITQNLRNMPFKLIMLPNLKKLIAFQDVPIDYKLKKFRYIRLRSTFYGLNYDRILLIIIYD